MQSVMLLKTPLHYMYIHEHTTLDVESRGGAEFATPLPPLRDMNETS